MILEKITIENFRNIKNAELEPSPGVNVIYGKNGQGKTNFLEAVWLMSGARSFRSGSFSDFINHGESFSRLRAVAGENRIELRLADKREIFLNEIKITDYTELLERFCAVVFAPNHLSLIKDSPARRRRFLDQLLCEQSFEYFDNLRTYERLLQQRNSLLKDARFVGGALQLIESYDERLAQCGEKIIEYRTALVDGINLRVPELYNKISGEDEKISFKYNKNIENDLFDELKRSFNNDLVMKTTGKGPHRDDVTIEINGRSAKLFGSQGQQRSIIIALKLFNSELLEKKTGEKPVIILDDVLSELDFERQQQILSNFAEKQIFISCCDSTHIKLNRETKLIKMEEGRLI